MYNMHQLSGLTSSTVCLKSKIKRILSTKQSRKLILALTILTFILFWILFIKLPRERAIKSDQVKNVIIQVLGRQPAREKLLLDKDTTTVPSRDICASKIFAVILVKSSPENINRRNTLRETWFQFLPSLDVKVEAYFFIGLPADGNITPLKEEASLNNDIILEDIQEHFYLLTLKTLRMLKWFTQSKCLEMAEYFIKTDDDMFLHVPNIISHINSVPQAWANYIGGDIHLEDRVITDPESKWFSPQEFWPRKYYPPYVNGALTIISSEVVPTLLNASLDVPLFHLEDIFLIGMVGFEKLNIVPSHIKGIETSSPLWLIRLKMALGFQDLPKTYIAFHSPDGTEFIRELYRQAIS